MATDNATLDAVTKVTRVLDKLPKDRKLVAIGCVIALLDEQERGFLLHHMAVYGAEGRAAK